MYNNFPVPTIKRTFSSTSSLYKYSCNDSTSCSTHNCEEDFEDESNFASIDMTQREDISLEKTNSDSFETMKTSPDAIIEKKSEVRRLSASGPKSSQLLFCMTLFQMHMKGKWDKKLEQEFLNYTQTMLDFMNNNVEMMKNQHAESIAASICLLVGSKIGISKKDFLDAMKPMKKNMLTKVEKIKKSTCYSIMKKAFKKLNCF